MKCKCGGQMVIFRGLTEDSDYIECNKCGERVYTNEGGMW
jgi:ribosomal protein S27E